MFFFILAGAGVLIVSLYRIQITQGSTYAARANKQYVRPVNTVFDRGTIYWSSKDGTPTAAATVSTGNLLYMSPKLVTDAAATYAALSQYVTLDKADFLARASRPNDAYEELVHHLDDSSAHSIAALGLKGVYVTKEAWRDYPSGSLAAQSVGIIGMNNDNMLTGRYGLERTYEDTLKRQPTAAVNIFASLFAGFGGGTNDTNPGDVVTTIEPTVQKFLEQTLLDTTHTWHPDEIGGVIMDPATGEIVALASLPDFDPNHLSEVKDPALLANPLVEHVYEMGSIVKPLTMAVALDTGAETPNSTYDDTGTMTLSGKKISNYDGKARGIIPMQEILSQSLNVGAATIALKVGKQDFSKYFFNFGLGDKTGIDEPNEATGITNNLVSGRDVEIATAAYGQGIAVSPVNITRALSILANGGYVVTPHLVREIDYVDGTKKKIDPNKNGPVLRPDTITDVTRMLVKVVDDKIAAAHPDIHFEHYSIAAKTGTAQIADHKNGGYYTDRYLHSFFGYFPAYNPRYLVFLYQIYPKGAQYASETLTDPFSKLTKFLISYYDVPPDR